MLRCYHKTCSFLSFLRPISSTTRRTTTLLTRMRNLLQQFRTLLLLHPTVQEVAMQPQHPLTEHHLLMEEEAATMEVRRLPTAPTPQVEATTTLHLLLEADITIPLHPHQPPLPLPPPPSHQPLLRRPLQHQPMERHQPLLSTQEPRAPRPLRASQYHHLHLPLIPTHHLLLAISGGITQH